MKTRHILVPLDGSAASEAALPTALALGRTSSATMVLLRVADVHREPGPLPADEVLAGVHEAERYVAEVRRRVAAEGLGQVTATVWCGAPTPAIIQAAARHGVDLIVMATHGRSDRERDMFGSVAEAVLRASDVPVLVVRPKGRGEGRPLAGTDPRRAVG
jgi:nucleotide-binding universal stress UspA family protein